MTRVAVTSLSHMKVGAVHNALAKLMVTDPVIIKFRSESAVGEQPRGIDQTQEGAINRLHAVPHDEYDYTVSIENGIHRLGARWIDLAVVAIETRDGRRSFATSAGVPIPQEAVDYADRMCVHIGRGVRATAHKDAQYNDPHAAITRGAWTRQQLLTQAVVMALIPVVADEHRA